MYVYIAVDIECYNSQTIDFVHTGSQQYVIVIEPTDVVSVN